jgi:GAF domain-containing protein
MKTRPAPSPEIVEPGIEVRDVEAFMEDLAVLAADSVAPALDDVSCGITVQQGEQQTSAAWSDARASQLDEIQYELDNGPCLHALRHQEIVVIADMDRDVDWPQWRERALAEGVGSSLSVPVPVIGVGGARAALNFYSSEPAGFDESSVERALDMANRAVRAIGLVSRLVDQEQHVEQMRTALGSRSVIDQALGIIMSQSKCDADEAFVILRKASHNRNLKLRTVATEIVERASGKPLSTPPVFQRR